MSQFFFFNFKFFLDLSTVVEYCVGNDEGLINDEVRREVWPMILDTRPATFFTEEPFEMAVHKDWDQVHKDVDRSLLQYKLNRPDKKLFKRFQLARLIHSGN